MESVDLRKYQQAQRPPQREAAQLPADLSPPRQVSGMGASGTLPFAPGAVMPSSGHGYGEGEQADAYEVPDMGAVERLAAELAAPPEELYGPEVKGAVMPPQMDISALPPEKQRELHGALADYYKNMAAAAPVVASGAPPQPANLVRENYAGTSPAATVRQQPTQRAQTIAARVAQAPVARPPIARPPAANTLNTPNTPQAGPPQMPGLAGQPGPAARQPVRRVVPPPSPGMAGAPGPGIAEAIAAGRQAEQFAASQALAVSPVVNGKQVAPSTLCPRCSWPTDQLELAQVTDDDKRNFVKAVLGLRRFEKSYSLLGGQLRMTFRTRTAEEEDTIMKQLEADFNSGTLSGAAKAVLYASRYQIALSLAELVVDGMPPRRVLELKAYTAEAPPAGQTLLPTIVGYFFTEVLPGESMWRLASKVYSEFTATVSRLEAMALDPNFSAPPGS